MTGAIADCERVIDGLLGQPANSLSALAFVGTAPILWRFGHRHVAAALAATGLGSFLFHGPMPPGSQWAHDVSLAWLLVAVGLADTEWQRFAGWPSAAGIGIALAIVPVAGDGLAAAAAAVAIGAILWRSRTRRTMVALGLLGLGALVGRLSATDGPWCRPRPPPRPGRSG